PVFGRDVAVEERPDVVAAETIAGLDDGHGQIRPPRRQRKCGKAAGEAAARDEQVGYLLFHALGTPAPGLYGSCAWRSCAAPRSFSCLCRSPRAPRRPGASRCASRSFGTCAARFISASPPTRRR